MSFPERIQVTLDSLTLGSNVEDLVESIQIQIGERQPNQFGALLRSASCAVILHNESGRYNSFETKSRVPVGGVAAVWVWLDGKAVPLFNGGIASAVNNYSNTGIQKTVVTCLGPLAYINEFSEGVFTRLDGENKASVILNLMLDNIVPDGGRIGNVVIDREIEPSVSELKAYRIRSASVTRAGSSRVKFAHGARLLARAEVGRIYDNQRGAIVFENRRHRSETIARYFTTWRFSENTPGLAVTNIQQRDPREFVVNIISSERQNIQSLGKQSIPLIPALPFEWDVSPGSNQNYQYFDLDTSGQIAYVGNWDTPVRGTHYTTNPANMDVVVATSDSGVTVGPSGFIPPSGGSIRLIKLEGRTFGVRNTYQINVRNQESIDVYGPKEVTYPADLIHQDDDLEDHLNWLLNVHSSLGTPGLRIGDIARIPRLMDVSITLTPQTLNLLQIEISDLVYITYPHIGLEGDDGYFWVEQINHNIEGATGTITTKLVLSDARGSVMWPRSQMVFGRDTRIGF